MAQKFRILIIIKLSTVF